MSDKAYKNIYPNYRHFMSFGRKSHAFVKKKQSMFSKRPET